MKTIAEQIKSVAQKRGYNYYSLAAALGIPRSTCHRIVSGQSAPSRKTLDRLERHGIRAR